MTQSDDRWSLGNPGNALMRAEWLLPALTAIAEARPQRILEVGCGRGRTLGDILGVVPAESLIMGADLDPEALQEARRNLDEASLVVSDGARLPFKDGGIDLVIMSTFLSSVPSSLHAQVAGEVARVLHPGALLIWYDVRYPNPGNRNLSPIRRAKLRRLFPRFIGRIDSVTLIPQLSRRLGTRAPSLYPLLNKIPALRTHQLAILRKAKS